MNITVRQITFMSTNMVNTIFGWIYIPAELPRGIVQICHGMAEHMGRYHDFMRYLAQNGYAACGIDQVGHGRSVQDEKYGFFGERDGWKTLVEDQLKFHKIIHTEVQDCGETAFLGHSMGSFIARLYAAKYGAGISGLILSGTARGGLRAPLAVKAAELSIRKHGLYYPDKGLNSLALGAANERFKPVRSKYDWLSRDAGLVRQFDEDPACGFIFTAAGYRDLFTLLDRASSKSCYETTRKDLPILMFSGSMDPVGEYGKGPAQVYQRYVKEGVRDVELTIYDGARHEMLNETNRLQVYDAVRGWLDDHFCAREPIDMEPDELES